MNDDDLGRALGTALRGPERRATADAGPRLRATARRDRTRQRLAGTAAVVAVLLLAAGLLTRLPGGPAAPVTAAGPTSGLTLLEHPLTLSLHRLPLATCVRTDVVRCPGQPVYLSVDQVLAVRAAAAQVRITLLPDDADTLATLAGQDISVGAAGVLAGRPLVAPADGGLTVDLGTPGAAAAFVADLGPYPAGPVRTGPGPLDVPFELWSVAHTFTAPCQVLTGPASVMVNRLGQCVELTGAGRVLIDSADVRILPPDSGDPQWRVLLTFDAADRPAVGAFTRANTGKDIGFVIGGVPVAGFPQVQGAFSESIMLSTGTSRTAAEAIVLRLRA
jgi:hypothetical protein